MKKVIIVKESILSKIVDRLINEQSINNEKTLCSAILGYIDSHWDKIVNNIFPDKMNGLLIKKEVMVYCENKRDGKPTKSLSNNSLPFYNTIKKMVTSSPNIIEYSNIGKNIKHKN